MSNKGNAKTMNWELRNGDVLTVTPFPTTDPNQEPSAKEEEKLPALPLDLRIEIWKLLAPKLVLIHYGMEKLNMIGMTILDQEWTWYVGDEKDNSSHTKIFQVCSEVARFVDPNYSFISYTHPKYPRIHQNGFFFSFKNDVLFTSSIRFPEIVARQKQFLSKVQNLGTVAKGGSGLFTANPRSSNSFLSEMKSLRTVFLLARDGKDIAELKSHRVEFEEMWAEQRKDHVDWKPLSFEIVKVLDLKPGDKNYRFHVMKDYVCPPVSG